MFGWGCGEQQQKIDQFHEISRTQQAPRQNYYSNAISSDIAQQKWQDHLQQETIHPPHIGRN
jgi:hypothetical protein